MTLRREKEKKIFSLFFKSLNVHEIFEKKEKDRKKQKYEIEIPWPYPDLPRERISASREPGVKRGEKL